MSVQRFQNLIGSARYKRAVDQNTNIGLELEQKTKPLIEYDIIDVVNLPEVFTEEREKSNKYRINGKINIYTTNSISSGSTVYKNGVFDDYAWNPLFQGDTPNNWIMQLLYPSDSLSDFQIKYYSAATSTATQISKAFRGPQYKKLDTTIINNSRYLAVVGIQKHNLKPDDYIYLNSNTNSNYRGIFKVLTLGLNGQNFDKDFVLDLSLDTLTTPQGVSPNSYYTAIPNGDGNFIKINNPSFDDISFSNSLTFFNVTTCDFSGNTQSIPYNNDEERFLTIKTNQPHNLKINNYVDIRVNIGNDLNGMWRVYNILDDLSGSTRFVIKADINIPNKGVTIQPAPMRDYKILDGIPSEYYVRKFEVLTTNDYEVYPCAFSTGIYPNINDFKLGLANKTWLFHFNEDVDLNKIKTNRKGPITELYYSIIKRSGKIPYDWGNVVSNWDFNIKKTILLNSIESVSINNPSNVGSVEKSKARKEFLNINGEIDYMSGDKYIVDFVEFNPTDLSETPLSMVNHVFRPPSTTPTSGYYYNPYKKLKLREYSKVINVISANENYDQIPDNYFIYPDGSKAWKDLLPIGYSENGVNVIDYPFLNNVNYYYFDFNLYIRRQVVPINNIIDNSSRLRYVKESDVNTKC